MSLLTSRRNTQGTAGW